MSGRDGGVKRKRNPVSNTLKRPAGIKESSAEMRRKMCLKDKLFQAACRDGGKSTILSLHMRRILYSVFI